MNCKKVKAILPELVSGEITGKTYADAMSHIDTCPTCRREMQSYKTALTSLSGAWQDAATPQMLESITLPETRGGRFTNFRFALAGAVFAIMIAAVILAFGNHRLPDIQVQQARIPSQTQEKYTSPTVTPYKHLEPKTEPTEKPKETYDKQPSQNIEKQKPKWDERRVRPRKQWDNCAKVNPKPVESPKTNENEVINEPVQISEEPKMEDISSECLPHNQTEEPSNTKPTPQKVVRQVVTYDRYGNKQILLVESEEQTPMPCSMAMY